MFQHLIIFKAVVLSGFLVAVEISQNVITKLSREAIVF